MTKKTLQYIAKIILLTLVVCQFGNAVQAGVVTSAEVEQKIYSPLSNASEYGHNHNADDSEQTCCIDDDEGRWQTDLNLDLYLPLSENIQTFATVVTSETNRHFINLKPIFPPLYLVFQSFLE